MSKQNILRTSLCAALIGACISSSIARSSDTSTHFTSIQLPTEPTVTAPDGSDVRVLSRLKAGSMAHFHLKAGQVSAAVSHRTVEEIWYVLSGDGFMWRKQGDRTQVTKLKPGLCLTIPLGTEFQFKAANSDLSIVAVTMPPWPGKDEAIPAVGPW